MGSLNRILIALAAVVSLACVALDNARGDEWPARPPAGWATDAVVVRLVDGDTLDVEIKRTLRVRLLDCWCPESRTRDAAEKARGIAATQHLAEICPVGSHVRLLIPVAGEELGRSLTLGRALGHVWLRDGDERSLSQQQVDSGHAVREKPSKQPPATSSRRPSRDWLDAALAVSLAI